VAFVAPHATRFLAALAAGVGALGGTGGGASSPAVVGHHQRAGTPLGHVLLRARCRRRTFLASTAFTFLIYKLVQIGAVAWYGLLTTALARDVGRADRHRAPPARRRPVDPERLDQRAFNRAVLALLGAARLWLIVRSGSRERRARARERAHPTRRDDITGSTWTRS